MDNSGTMKNQKPSSPTYLEFSAQLPVPDRRAAGGHLERGDRGRNACVDRGPDTFAARVQRWRELSDRTKPPLLAPEPSRQTDDHHRAHHGSVPGAQQGLRTIPKRDVQRLEEFDTSNNVLEASLRDWVDSEKILGHFEASSVARRYRDFHLRGPASGEFRALSIHSFPSAICQLESLKHLEINRCLHLRSVPENIGNLTQLISLTLAYCTSVEELPASTTKLRNLRWLSLVACKGMRQPLAIATQLTSLYRLTLNMSDVYALPGIQNLDQLKVLDLQSCHKLEQIPNVINDLSCLRTIDLKNCLQLRGKPLPTWLERPGLTVHAP